MSSNNYKQLLIGGIILGSLIFFSNHLLTYAQELPSKIGDTPGETLDIIIPSPILSGQELGGQQEPRSSSSVIQSEMIQQRNQEEEKGIEILDQQEDKGQEIQEDLEKDGTGIATSNIIEEEEEEEQNNEQGNADVPFVLPFP